MRPTSRAAKRIRSCQTLDPPLLYEKQGVKSSMKKEKLDMSYVLSKLDGDTTSMEDVQRALELFSEILEREVEHIDPNEPWTAACFKTRFDNVRSSLSLIQCCFVNVLNQTKSDVDEGYRVHKGESK